MNEKMNVLMMSKIFAQSGVGTHIKDLSKQLIKMGHKVHFMAATNEWGDYCRDTGIVFNEINFTLSPIEMVKNLGQIYRYIKAQKIDIVHCHHRTCGVYMRILSAITGVPFVWSNHLDDIPHDFIHRSMTFCGRKAICVSTELQTFCVEKLHIPEKKTCVIIHGIDPNAYHSAENYVARFKKAHSLTDEKVVGLFGRMAPMKGHKCLIEALAQIPLEKRDRIKVVFFGGTAGKYVDELKAEIRKYGLENSIIFEGFVTPSEALSLSDITVLPSLKEGFGIVSIESFLFKKPHIRTKTAGYEDIKDGCVGFDVGDSSALSQELICFIDGKDYSDLVARASQLLNEKCTLESMTNQVIEVYTEAMQ